MTQNHRHDSNHSELARLIAAGMPINGVRQFDEATSASMLDSYGFGPDAPDLGNLNSPLLFAALHQAKSDAEIDCVAERYSIVRQLNEIDSLADLRFILALVVSIQSVGAGELFLQLHSDASKNSPPAAPPLPDATPATGSPA